MHATKIRHSSNGAELWGLEDGWRSRKLELYLNKTRLQKRIFLSAKRFFNLVFSLWDFYFSILVQRLSDKKRRIVHFWKKAPNFQGLYFRIWRIQCEQDPLWKWKVRYTCKNWIYSSYSEKIFLFSVNYHSLILTNFKTRDEISLHSARIIACWARRWKFESPPADKSPSAQFIFNIFGLFKRVFRKLSIFWPKLKTRGGSCFLLKKD